MKGSTLAIAIAALAMVGVASGGTRASTAGNPSTFPDRAGDSGSGSDITEVAVGNTTAGVIGFEISIANAVLLTDDHFVGVYVDADRNPATGFAEGFEYSIQTAGSLGRLLLGHWNGTEFEEVSAPSLAKVWEVGGTMTFRVARADLGNTTGFLFFAATEVLPGDDTFDDTAPDGVASFDYTLSTPAIAKLRPRFAPAAPRAGRAFGVAGVNVRLASEEDLPASTFRCHARVGGKALRGRGVGGCRFSLARNTRGKRLVLVITATLRDRSRTLRTTFRVR